MALSWYWFINPWYLKNIVFPAFPKWLASRNPWKISFISVLIDSLIGQWPKVTIHLLFTNMWSNKGDMYKSFKDWQS